MTESKKPTCGVMYQDAIREYATGPETLRAFAAGFVHGQAEKVYLGVCPAAMFRPSVECAAMVLGAVASACKRYGLKMIVATVGDDVHHEFWIHRSGGKDVAMRWEQFPAESPEWHLLRAVACGIPADKIDLRFHERRGYGEACDRVSTEKGAGR